MKLKWIPIALLFLNHVTTSLSSRNEKQKPQCNYPVQGSSFTDSARQNTSPKFIASSTSLNNGPLPEADIIQDILETYFPDVTYPTSVLEVQPFYYKQSILSDAVLEPFPNDVKTSFKALTTEKESSSHTLNQTLPIQTNKNETSEKYNKENVSPHLETTIIITHPTDNEDNLVTECTTSNDLNIEKIIETESQMQHNIRLNEKNGTDINIVKEENAATVQNTNDTVINEYKIVSEILNTTFGDEECSEVINNATSVSGANTSKCLENENLLEIPPKELNNEMIENPSSLNNDHPKDNTNLAVDTSKNEELEEHSLPEKEEHDIIIDDFSVDNFNKSFWEKNNRTNDCATETEDEIPFLVLVHEIQSSDTLREEILSIPPSDNNDTNIVNVEEKLKKALNVAELLINLAKDIFGSDLKTENTEKYLDKTEGDIGTGLAI